MPVTNGPIPLTLAINDYDHCRSLVAGEVQIQGVSLTSLQFPVEEIFWRFPRYREWHVSELSFAKYCWMRAQGEDVTAIPVFPSRTFRHSAIFVAADGPVDDPKRLQGGRIGIPEWTVTATVFGRGILQDEYGIGLQDVEWVQAGTNQPGRKEGVAVDLPGGVAVTAEPEKTLNDMLIAGEIDAVIAPHAPDDFEAGTGKIVQLFSDPRSVEEASFRATGIFPIMHVIAIRGDVYREHPWVAMNLLEAFSESKRRCYERTFDVNAPRAPIPWAALHAEEMRELFDGDPWPYGIEKNRATLEAFLRYTHEQGITPEPLSPNDLFASEVATKFIV